MSICVFVNTQVSVVYFVQQRIPIQVCLPINLCALSLCCTSVIVLVCVVCVRQKKHGSTHQLKCHCTSRGAC